MAELIQRTPCIVKEKVMLKIKIYLFAFVVIIGCAYRHVDKITQFVVKGAIHDSKTGSPISQIDVNFIDTGFDDVLCNHHLVKKIGESDNGGVVNIEFDFFWGETKGLLKRESKKSFMIELTGEKYQKKRFYFKADELAIKSGKIIVPLGEILLKLKGT